MSEPILSIRGLTKTYGTGVQALKATDLDIRRGEIFALLGPNGAGKTTLINIVCGIVTASGGEVLIAKALSHEPSILFLDEPTAGVDVELRRDMWELVRQLRADGTTIILTTHYIEEAEEMADRVGVISHGELIAVDDKQSLMARMGRKTLDIMLAEPIAAIPSELSEWTLRLEDNGHALCYEFDSHADRTGIASLMRRLGDLGIAYKDLSTHQSSLEDIFVELVHQPRVNA